MRYLVISDIHANLEALEAVMAARRAARLGPGARARRPRRLRRRSERRRRARARPGAARADPRQSRQGGLGLETAEGFNAVARSAIQLDAATPSPTRTARGSRRCRPVRWMWTTSSKSATARRSTRTPTSSTTSTRCAHCTPPGGRCACSVTRTYRSATASATTSSTWKPTSDTRPLDIALDGRHAVPDQPRARSANRATATRAPASRSSTPSSAASRFTASPTPWPGRRLELSRKGCRRFSRSGWRSDGRVARPLSDW